jgi:hypothetical protein
MGVVSLFIVLVVVIVASSYIIRFVSSSLSGFENVPAAPSSNGCVVSGNQAELYNRGYIPDKDTYYMCNTLSNGETCTEGTFCNGVADECTPIAASMFNDGVKGYFS